MVLQFELTQADYRVAQGMAVRHMRANGATVAGEPRRRVLRRMLLGVAAWAVLTTVALICVLQITGLRLPRGMLLTFGYGVMAASLFVMLVTLLITRRMQARQLQTLAPYPVPHTFQLHPEGLSVTNRYGESRLTWLAFLRAEQLPAHVGLLLRPGSVLVIPNSAFASPVARQEFLAIVRRHLSASAAA